MMLFSFSMGTSCPVLIRVENGALFPVKFRLIHGVFQIHIISILRLIIGVDCLALGGDIESSLDTLLTTQEIRQERGIKNPSS